MTRIISNTKRGASILLLSLVFMFLLLLLAVTLFQIIPAELHAANRSHQDLNGHYVARAGVQHTKTWLRHQLLKFDREQDETELPDYTPDGKTYPNIEDFKAKMAAENPFQGTGWSFELELEPQQDTLGLANNFEPRLFAVRSTALFNGQPIRRMDVLLRQRTFASFAFYTETFDPETAFILTGESKIFGPVHTNDFFNFDVTALENQSWTDLAPYFTDVVTHSSLSPDDPSGGDGNLYTGGRPYDENGPIAGRYENLFEGGRNNLRLKNRIELPSSTDAVFASTWTDTANIPQTDGVFLSQKAGDLNGGLYIRGDVEKLNLRLDRHGNQRISVRQTEVVGTQQVPKTKRVRKIPLEPYPCRGRCLERKFPNGAPSGGDGGAGGVGGATASQNNPCVRWEMTTCYRTEEVPDGFRTVNVRAVRETDVYEVTEAPVEVTDQDGKTVTAQTGQTIVVRSEGIDGAPVSVKSVEVLDGQINGNIYVDGNIGDPAKRNSDKSGAGTRLEGLWGITKGSAVVDDSGDFVLDSAGHRTYNNKAIVTPLDKSISLGGDLLQFDPVRFQAERAAGTNFATTSGGVRNWTRAALDPNKVVDGKRSPERSPNSDHVLGLITRDIWMSGSRTTDRNNSFHKERLGGDEFNDAYFVGLAGVTETDSAGNPLTDANGEVITSGGFGTWHSHRNNVNDKLGRFSIVGGIIQGTVGANHGAPDKQTHHWIDGSGSAGYEVDLFYDIEATRQRIFPVQPEFSIVRLYERTARES